ncbi:19065_t:CDS:2 [Rhizophagus irregularis]|nr:19065_t:CDS:2 [Rhizophagus irregularis]
MVFDTLEAEKLIHLNTLRNDLKKYISVNTEQLLAARRSYVALRHEYRSLEE